MVDIEKFITNNIDKEFVASAFDDVIFDEVFHSVKVNLNSHKKLLQKVNGGYLLSRSLHIFGACESPDFHSLKNWNGNSLWRHEFEDLTEGLIFFAENIFAEQFAYSSDGICHFYPETAHREIIAQSFEEWMELIQSDPDRYCGESIIKMWAEENGGLPDFGHHLCPSIPFALEGEYSTENMFEADAIHYMGWKAFLAKELYNLPDGAEIKFEFE